MNSTLFIWVILALVAPGMCSPTPIFWGRSWSYPSTTARVPPPGNVGRPHHHPHPRPGAHHVPPPHPVVHHHIRPAIPTIATPTRPHPPIVGAHHGTHRQHTVYHSHPHLPHVGGVRMVHRSWSW